MDYRAPGYVKSDKNGPKLDRNESLYELFEGYAGNSIICIPEVKKEDGDIYLNGTTQSWASSQLVF